MPFKRVFLSPLGFRPNNSIVLLYLKLLWPKLVLKNRSYGDGDDGRGGDDGQW
jgi:hypothetical protein